MSSEAASASAAFLSLMVPPNTVPVSMKLGGMMYMSFSSYFDCSSFTYWVYSQLGVILQHGGSNTAASQGRYITENNLAVSYGSLAPGDLVFYSFGVNNRYLNIDHVAIYAGDGYVVSNKNRCRLAAYSSAVCICSSVRRKTFSA